MSSKGDRVEETQCAEDVNSSCGGVNLQARDLLSRSDNYSNEGLDPLGCGEGTLHIPSDKEDIRNEPEGNNDHSGTARTSNNLDGGEVADGGEMVNLSKIKETYLLESSGNLRPQTQRQYMVAFEQFWKENDLEGCHKRQIQTQKVRQALKQFITRRSRGAWNHIYFRLQSVWQYGLGLPFPLNAKRDLGRARPTRRGHSPPDDIVRKWKTALDHEPDIYIRVLWLTVANLGLRWSHLKLLKWSHFEYKDGRPYNLEAHEEFKSDAPVAAYIPPELADHLVQWREQNTTDYVYPMKMANGTIQVPHESYKGYMLRKWNGMAKRWKLPKLTSKDLRHWVQSVCRKVGMSYFATNRLVGHKPTIMNMRDWYDNPNNEEAILEQAETLPNGALGWLDPKIEVTTGLPPEIIELVHEYLDGKVGSFEVAKRLEELRVHILKP